MPKYLIAHDIGTSGNKASLFTTDGQLVKSTVSVYPTDYFSSNYAEQTPEDWWRAVCESTKELLHGIDNKEVLAVSFSGQMMGCVCVDKQGKALRKAIIWADMRAEEEARYLQERICMDRFYRTVGHRISSAYSIEKLMWVKAHEPDVYRNTHKMLLAKDYIIYKLTGQFLTDFSDASGTNAFDLNTFQWSEEILAAAGIDGALLPEAVASTTIAGEITNKVSQECGLAPGTMVVVGGGDGMCASVGAGSIAEGKTYNCLGSSSWICTTSKAPIYDDQYRTFNWAHIVPGMIGPCGTMQAAGASFSWLKNEVCTLETERAQERGISPYELINEQIAGSQPGANGLLFLPYLMGERSPRWNANAKGAFVGLKMEHRRADMLRSVVEGIGLNLNIILQILRQHIPIEEMTVIGGLAKGGIQRQILADIYGMRILRLNHLEEATSIGAAVTAGVGIGVHKSFDDVYRYIEVDAIEEPTAANTAVYQKMQPIFDKAYFDLVDVFEGLCQL